MDEQEPRVSRLVVVMAGLAGVVLLALLLLWALGGPGRPPAQPEAAAPASPAPPPVAVARPDAEPAPSDTPAERPRARRKAPAAPKPEPAPAAPTLGELRIDSDVPGAMVFLDRKYLGETPVTARDVPPGPHTLNALGRGLRGPVARPSRSSRGRPT